MSKDAQYLEKRGWRQLSSKKAGCFKMVTWHHYKHGTYSQAQAVILQRLSDRTARQGKWAVV